MSDIQNIAEKLTFLYLENYAQKGTMSVESFFNKYQTVYNEILLHLQERDATSSN